ncbi:MAG TPA: hypothetical protein VMR34_04470 [Candidatus Saccharimonadales bacterium]|nr:hypothetical protein [Candidatus Saccharimonadales bacterium]
MSRLEVYNARTHAFRTADRFAVLDLQDYYKSKSLPGGKDVFARLRVYGLTQALTDTARYLNNHEHIFYLAIPNSVVDFKEIADSDLPIRPVVDISRPPTAELTGSRGWERQHIEEAIGADCVGVLVNLENSQLADEFGGEHPFFRISHAPHAQIPRS